MFGNNNNGYSSYQPQYGGGMQQHMQPQQTPAKLDSLDDLLSGSGAKAFFNGDSQIGASVTGIIELVETTQMHDFQTKQPAFWNDGRPQMQIHIVLQTTLRDPSVDDDDGRRSLWIKGWGIQLKAFREACRQANVKHPKNGDTMTATFTGFGERGNAPQPPKVYEYRITPENGLDTLLGQQQPQQQPPVGQYRQQPQQSSQPMPQPAAYQQPQAGQYPQGAPQYQQPQMARPQQVAGQYQQPVQQQPMTPQVNPQQIMQLKSIGKPPQEIAGLLGLTLQQVLQVTDAASPSMHQGSEEEEPSF